jgi:ribonuclease PH
VSVGILNGEPLLDLNYVEDKDAEVDLNVVMTESGEFVEIQAAGEEAVFAQSALDSMLALGRKGITELLQLQNSIITKS